MSQAAATIPPQPSAVVERPPLRVLVVIPLAEQRGGGELMLLNLIEHGRGRGVEWIVAFFSDGPMLGQVRGWGVETFIVPAGRLRQPHRMLGAIMALRGIVRDRGVDLVLSWMGKAQLYGGTAAWLAGKPSLWYQLGLPDPPNWQDRWATRIPNRGALTCSDAATRAQKALRPHRPTHTVYPGVDLSRFDPATLPTSSECRRKLGLSADGPLIGIVGRLQRWKGMHHLVAAMPAVLEKHPDAYCVIVGGPHAFEPEYPEFLSAEIRRLGLSERVVQAGLQSNVPEWMQAIDVFVHASDNEPFGIVVIEAMALGKPVVATNTAGPSEIITDGVDGLLWPSGDITALSSALLRMLDPTTGPTLAARARVRAQAFTVERYAEQVVELTRQAVERSSHSRV